ncbi:S8 family serine peptidase [Photobacterium lutimaris]|uniref:Serine proteinase n=1 Tax=Photobacterium lutimaris TaxID=388278 RepID=A0A2T3J2Y6_9GAMM|nr:S8 family serine peptidase [Photobacterium lutimaris]PSU35662.1 serine proteinase [Photobacterium lutimaris]TDR78721.1 serine protease [Photobacterium lutimaris]
MKKVFDKSCHVVVFGAVLGFHFSAHASELGAPFRAGEVVVAALPEELSGETLIRHYPNAGLSVIRADKGKELDKIKQQQSKGRKAGKNFVAEHFVHSTNDPLASYQWHFDNVQADTAWTISAGANVIVAVLDTGLAESNDDGIGCTDAPRDIVNNDGLPLDGNGHGTHVAGTIAQRTNNSIGVSGLAYESCIMPVKVLNDSGSGSFADIAEGIYWAVNNGAKVINMSLGVNARYGITNDSVMDPALDYAATNEVVVVAAAGNDGSRKNVSYPAIYPSVIAVGATDYNNGLASYSNRGQGLDIVAPGGDTRVDANNDGYADGVLQETTIDNVTGYYFFQGTSMAAPHVSAIAAMLFASGKTYQGVIEAMQASALDLGSRGYDSSFGHGLVQAYSALQWVPGNDDGVNPICTDIDGDGYCLEVDDCDDENAQVNPSRNEKGPRRNDGLDNNCNGIIDG